MAVRLLVNEVSDLCLGKPALRCLSVSATVADAISALRRSDDGFVSVWTCDHSSKKESAAPDFDACRCIGKVCMVDIVCFLCKEENLQDPAAALQSPVEAIIPKAAGLVRHLEPHASLLEAIELILEGAQNLVVPILSRSSANSRKKLIQRRRSTTLHNKREYCWLTQEDIVRYLLNSISFLSPAAVRPINCLDIISSDSILTIHYNDPAASVLPLIAESQVAQTAVAIVDSDGRLLGEISPYTLNYCDLSVSAAVNTLSAGDLMAFIDCGGPPEDLVQVVKRRLEERNLTAFIELMGEEESKNSYPHSSSSASPSSSSASSSSDEEFGTSRSRRSGSSYSSRMVRRSEAIVCYPWSSLIAVMIQALAHRVSYVWVVEEDGILAGILTFASMMKVFHERLKSMSEELN